MSTKGTEQKGRNLELWDRVFATDPKHTKGFTRSGGFRGTAIKPMYSFHKATEEFGAMGEGWGWEVLEDRIEHGPEERSIWFSKVRVWYRKEPGGEVFWTGAQWGATELVAKRKDGGYFMDEEAAKKSVTDAATKCLSYLGFGGDVHMGMFDDSKYVSRIAEEKAAEERAEEQRAKEAQAAAEETDEQRTAASAWYGKAIDGISKCKDAAELKQYWELVKPHYEKFNQGSPAERSAAFQFYQAVTKAHKAFKKPPQTKPKEAAADDAAQ